MAKEQRWCQRVLILADAVGLQDVHAIVKHFIGAETKAFVENLFEVRAERCRKCIELSSHAGTVYVEWMGHQLSKIAI